MPKPRTGRRRSSRPRVESPCYPSHRSLSTPYTDEALARELAIASSDVPSNTVARLELEAFLGELIDESRPVVFIPCPGNAGDAMIALATFQLFDRIGLAYESPIRYQRHDPSGRVVVCGGGGNLIPLYDRTARMLQWAAGRAKRLILLPHTIQGNEELLAGFGLDVDLICREQVSYRYASGVVRSAQCHLADDMALHLDLDAALSREPALPSQPSVHLRRWIYRVVAPGLLKTLPSPRKVRRCRRLIASRPSGSDGSASEGTLNAFRTDLEKTDMPLPADNQDVARLFSHGTANPWVSQTSTFQMLQYLDTFPAVRTNRLHTAVGAALLGKRVRFHPNSYFKNRAVYEFSMRDRFPNVEWVENTGSDLE